MSTIHIGGSAGIITLSQSGNDYILDQTDIVIGGIKLSSTATASSLAIYGQTLAGIYSEADDLAINILDKGYVQNSGDAVRVTGDNVHITNNYAILGGADDGNGSGLVVAGDGARITNTGAIEGFASGLFLNGDHAIIDNSGTISAKSLYNNIVDLSGSDIVFTNSGKIDGTGFVSASSNAGGTIQFINTGTVATTSGMFLGGEGKIKLTNSGSILGEIALGQGNDEFRNNGGTVGGEIHGRSGDDLYTVDKAGLKLVEFAGEGTDTVRSSVNWTLGANFEKLQLVGSVAIKAIGNSIANTIDGNSAANFIDGNGGNDVLRGYGNADRIEGGAGNDKIIGGKGMDKLWGQAGADQFIFEKGDTTKYRATADTIFDFQHAQGDKIHLALIDANEKIAGNQAFHFIGSNAFTGHAGELRYVKEASDTYIYADTNGDRIKDLVIHLDDAMTLKSSDFIL